MEREIVIVQSTHTKFLVEIAGKNKEKAEKIRRSIMEYLVTIREVARFGELQSKTDGYCFEILFRNGRPGLKKAIAIHRDWSKSDLKGNCLEKR